MEEDVKEIIEQREIVASFSPSSGTPLLFYISLFDCELRANLLNPLQNAMRDTFCASAIL